MSEAPPTKIPDAELTDRPLDIPESSDDALNGRSDGRTLIKDPAWTQKELLDAWFHQNNLVWSRLQTISALQIAIIAGWGAVVANEPFRAFCVGLLGLALTTLIWIAIKCDLGARSEIDKKIQALKLELPFRHEDPNERQKKRGRGTKLIHWIAGILIAVDVLLVATSGFKAGVLSGQHLGSLKAITRANL